MQIDHNRTPSARKISRLLAYAAALAMGGALATGTAAHAASPEAAVGGHGLAAHALRTGAYSPMTPITFSHTLTVAPYATVNCTLTPSNPFRYYGSLYGGGEEGLANVQCSYTVSEIDVQVGLYRNGTLVATSPVKQAYSTTQAGADTEYPVSPATYQTGAVAGVQFTDGYVYSPPEAWSSTVNITS